MHQVSLLSVSELHGVLFCFKVSWRLSKIKPILLSTALKAGPCHVTRANSSWHCGAGRGHTLVATPGDSLVWSL